MLCTTAIVSTNYRYCLTLRVRQPPLWLDKYKCNDRYDRELLLLSLLGFLSGRRCARLFERAVMEEY